MTTREFRASTTFERTAGVVFSTVALLQALRLARRTEVSIGGYRAPFWGSAVAFAVTGSLAAWAFSLASAEAKQEPPLEREHRASYETAVGRRSAAWSW